MSAAIVTARESARQSRWRWPAPAGPAGSLGRARAAPPDSAACAMGPDRTQPAALRPSCVGAHTSDRPHLPQQRRRQEAEGCGAVRTPICGESRPSCLHSPALHCPAPLLAASARKEREPSGWRRQEPRADALSWLNVVLCSIGASRDGLLREPVESSISICLSSAREIAPNSERRKHEAWS